MFSRPGILQENIPGTTTEQVTYTHAMVFLCVSAAEAFPGGGTFSEFSSESAAKLIKEGQERSQFAAPGASLPSSSAARLIFHFTFAATLMTAGNFSLISVITSEEGL